MIAAARPRLRPVAVSLLIAAGLCGTSAKSEQAGQALLPASAVAAPNGPRGADFTLSGELTQGGFLRGIAPRGTVSLQLNGTELPIAGDGAFLIAFDRDAPPSAELVARTLGGLQVKRELAVSRRAWRIEPVGVGPRPSALPSEEFRIRRAAELVRINAARALQVDSQGWRQQFIWPAQGRLSGLFGSQRIYRGTPGSFHSGTDIAAGSGAAIVAPADGVVILAAQSPFTLEGNLLMIAHGMGLNSAFLHCSQLLVREGEHVRRGQLIARVGMTGRATGPHLHWSLKWLDSRLDPLLFAGPMQ